MQQGNVGSVKKKDVEGELGRISAQMPVVHVVQRNVKARIADTPLILLNLMLKNQCSFVFHCQKYYGKWYNNQYIFVVIF